MNDMNVAGYIAVNKYCRMDFGQTLFNHQR